MHWIKKEDLAKVNLADELRELLQVMLDEDLTEFQYVIEADDWKIILK